MSTVPRNPKIYHITHIDNLAGIVEDGVLWSDARRIEHGKNCEIVGISGIKRDRLHVPVKCHIGTMVGQYVPFNFCPRSVMLFILYRSNHPDITYHGGQGPMIHLQADLAAVIQWANTHSIRWAFTNVNARAGYADFFKKTEDLVKINWPAVETTDFRDAVIQDCKQAEFLVYESFPWHLVEKIGVFDEKPAVQVRQAISNLSHRPLVSVEKTWYY